MVLRVFSRKYLLSIKDEIFSEILELEVGRIV